MWLFRRRTKTVEIARMGRDKLLSVRLVLATPVTPPVKISLEEDELFKLTFDSDRDETRLRVDITPSSSIRELLEDAVSIELLWGEELLFSSKIRSIQSSSLGLIIQAWSDPVIP